MAEIQIVYREGYCAYDGADYCTQCHTGCAQDLGCRMFNEGKHEEDVIPFGDCIHAKFKYIYKGMNVKNYELEELQDTYNPHLNCMTLETINKIYECAKVILDGKCIYNEYEEGEKRKGCWLINSDGYYPYCSICNNEPKSRIMTDYCPSCGAYMKGECHDQTTSN